METTSRDNIVHALMMHFLCKLASGERILLFSSPSFERPSTNPIKHGLIKRWSSTRGDS